MGPAKAWRGFLFLLCATPNLCVAGALDSLFCQTQLAHPAAQNRAALFLEAYREILTLPEAPEVSSDSLRAMASGSYFDLGAPANARMISSFRAGWRRLRQYYVDHFRGDFQIEERLGLLLLGLAEEKERAARSHKSASDASRDPRLLPHLASFQSAPRRMDQHWRLRKSQDWQFILSQDGKTILVRSQFSGDGALYKTESGRLLLSLAQIKQGLEARTGRGPEPTELLSAAISRGSPGFLVLGWSDGIIQKLDVQTGAIIAQKHLGSFRPEFLALSPTETEVIIQDRGALAFSVWTLDSQPSWKVPSGRILQNFAGFEADGSSRFLSWEGNKVKRDDLFSSDSPQMIAAATHAHGGNFQGIHSSLTHAFLLSDVLDSGQRHLTVTRISFEGRHALVSISGVAQNASAPFFSLSENAEYFAYYDQTKFKLGLHHIGNTIDIIRLKGVPGHDDSITSIALSPNGLFLVAGSETGNLRIWSTGSGNLKERLRGHATAIRYLQFSTDGTLLLSRSDDGKIHSWDARHLADPGYL
jgi:WD40 repeat protein